jgi:Homing endonuclease associated repeat
MARRPARELLASLDRDALAQFQAGIRKRYSDEEIVEQLLACAHRLGRSPSMREFSADPETSVHPQTVIEHFGSWNAAKRAAGLVPRRFATREELLSQLRELGERLGRTPTARDLDEHRRSMPSKSLYWHTFGSLTNALREAGFDVPVGEERLERAVDQGSELAVQLGHLPKFQEWAVARKDDPALLTEWQVYRMFDVRRGAWSTFQFLIRERLLEDGYEVSRDGKVSGHRGKRGQQA